MFQTKKSFKELLEDFVDDNGLKEAYYLMQIEEKADQIFKTNIEKKIKFQELKRGNLVLLTESSAWREEIKLRKDEIIGSINKVFEKNIIKSIEVK